MPFFIVAETMIDLGLGSNATGINEMRASSGG